MQYTARCALVLCAWSLSIAVAADNTKLIDTVIRNYGEATSKANELRSKSVAKSKSETISQLAKLASKAYSEKDRLAETNAWKAVLRLDRSHPKAVQYFKDLGTLEQTLKELPADKRNGDEDPLVGFVGKWKVTYNVGSTEVIEFAENGAYTTHLGLNMKCEVEPLPLEGAVIVTYPGGDHLNRYLLNGDRLFVEQWAPASRYPKTTPPFFGRVVRVE